jgi:transcriptional regulator NrdR family protein
MKHIVKRRGQTELFDERKLYAGVYSSCLAVRTPEGSAELTAEKITELVKQWLADKKEVTSSDIHRQAVKHLKIYNPDAAILHDTHRSLS